MIRGTFANIKIKNKLISEEGPFTKLKHDDPVIPIFDACE